MAKNSIFTKFTDKVKDIQFLAGLDPEMRKEMIEVMANKFNKKIIAKIDTNRLMELASAYHITTVGHTKEEVLRKLEIALMERVKFAARFTSKKHIKVVVQKHNIRKELKAVIKLTKQYENWEDALTHIPTEKFHSLLAKLNAHTKSDKKEQMAKIIIITLVKEIALEGLNHASEADLQKVAVEFGYKGASTKTKAEIINWVIPGTIRQHLIDTL